MHKSIARFGAFLSLLIAFQASAVTINGLNYKQYTGGGSKCPDGSGVLVKGGVKYCRAYRANLNWVIPSTRTNGAALPMSELAGYEVYWTRTSDKATGTVKVSGGGTKTAVFDAYTPSTYYFAVSAIDTKGAKSPLSTMVQASLGK
jgi:hypothetical protein